MSTRDIIYTLQPTNRTLVEQTVGADQPIPREGEYFRLVYPDGATQEFKVDRVTWVGSVGKSIPSVIISCSFIGSV